MNRNFKKCISFLLVLALSFSLSFPAFAQEKTESPNLKSYAANQISGAKINDQYELYDLNDNVTAYLFTLETGGYIIMNSKDYSIPEYSLTSKPHYILDGSKMYYGGVLNYYQSSNDSIKNTLTKDTITEDDQNTINSYSMVTTPTQLKSSAPISPLAASTTYFISGTLPNYSYNPDGRCGVTASAMWLRYYDIYKDTRYVPSLLVSTSGQELIDYLYPYIQNNGGSYPGGVKFGLLDFLGEQGVYPSLSMDNPSIGIIAGYVSNNKPYILFINNSKYGSHVVAGYGYNTGSGTDYAIVNDGWGSKGVYISLSSATQIVG